MKAAIVLPALLLLGIATPSPDAAHGPVVHIRDYKFVPAQLTIAPNTAVTFVNDDDDAHTATAVDKSWDSTGLGHGDHFTHVFTSPGTVRYLCTLHPYMKGTIVVGGKK